MANSRDQSIEMPQSRKSRWKAAIDSAIETRGWTPVLIAWFSAGRPNAVSYTHLTLPTIYSV